MKLGYNYSIYNMTTSSHKPAEDITEDFFTSKINLKSLAPFDLP